MIAAVIFALSLLGKRHHSLSQEGTIENFLHLWHWGLFLFRLAMIEQERRDRELALRLAQDPEALDAEAQQAPQLPLQRCKHRID